MTGFELRTSDIVSDHSTNWATTTAHFWYSTFIQVFDINDPFVGTAIAGVASPAANS